MRKPTIDTTLCWCVMLLLLLTSCYNNSQPSHDAFAGMSEQQLDSLSFQSQHHYTNNFNFLIARDSLLLLTQSIEEIANLCPVDSADIAVVRRGDNVVVAEIQTIPHDPVDSVWINLVRDAETSGWVRESEMLRTVVPDDPISLFIDTFSDVHLIISLIIIVLITLVYSIVLSRRKHAYIVHFHDISSLYPTVLCIAVAVAATFYASIQMFAPEMWRHFYYHPTLNPLEVPLLLRIFLCSLWAILLLAVAAVDDTRRHLPLGPAAIYLLGLMAVCAVNYIVFSFTTIHYIGYPLLAIYIIFALYRFFRQGLSSYLCGACGARMKHKGPCPKCGAVNQ